jgi:PAS domain S-box-containing protein
MKNIEEISRAETLQSYHILDTLPEKEFDDITVLAAYICNAPISLVTLLDSEKQYFKSHYGLKESQIPIEHSFCKHAIETPGEIFIIEDARKDSRFNNNPLVINKPNIVFYAGVPLISPTGIALGALCVMDNMPKTINHQQINSLKALANQVVQLFELRKKKTELEQQKSITEATVKKDELIRQSEERFRGFYESQTSYFIRTDIYGNYTYINKKFIENFGWLYPDGNILGVNSLSSILERDHHKVIAIVEKCFSAPGKVYKVELDKPTQEGNYVTTLWDFVCIVDAEGIPEEIQCIGIDISERIKYERALFESNERFEYVTQATSDAIYDWDINNDVFTWGEGFYRIFGYPKTNSLFRLKKWETLSHPIDAEKNRENRNTFFADKNKNRFTSEFRFQRANGSYAYVEEIAQLIRDKNGKPLRMIGVLRDKSKAKYEEIQQQIEREVANIFKENNTLSETINLVLKYLCDFGSYKAAEIWLVSRNRKQLNLISTYASDEKFEEFYRNTSEIKKFAFGEGFPGIIWKNEHEEVLEDTSENISFIRKDAAKIAGMKSAIGIPLFYNKNIVGVLVFGSDKTAKEEEYKVINLTLLKHLLGAEIKRKQQEEELHLFFESAPEILAIASPHGHFTKVNPAFCKLLGYSEEEITSNKFEYFIHPDDFKNTKTEYTKNIHDEQQANNFVNRYRTKDGNYKWISWNSSKVFGEDGYMFAYGRDITEIKELQQLFENAAKLAHVGSWELNLENLNNNNMYWSPMTKDILEVDAGYTPSITDGFDFFNEPSKTEIKNAIEKLIEVGDNFDLELLLTTQKGNSRWVRCIGESERTREKCTKIFGSIQDIHQLKIAELDLKAGLKALEDYKFALDQSAIIAITNSKGVITSVNDNFCKISKYQREELIGNTHSVVNSKFHPQDFFKELWRTISSGEVWRGEIKNKAKDGTYYWMDTTIVPFVDEKNKPFQYLAIRFDITDRKLADEKVFATLEEKNIILESIGDGFFAVDRNWIITYWNQQAEIILRKKKEQVLGHNLWDIFSDAKEHNFYKLYHQALETGKSIVFDDYYPAYNMWVEVSAYPSEQGLSVYFKDITTRKNAEEEVRLSNERFEKVTEATNDAIWDWDIINDTLYWGNGFKILFGYDTEKATPTIQSWVNNIHSDEMNLVVDSINVAIKDSATSHWIEEYRLKKSNGKYAYVIDRGIIMRDDNGKAVRMLGAMTDITYRKEYEESLKKLNEVLRQKTVQLSHSNAELEQFAYVASHDLQEPLRMVSGFLTKIEDRYEPLLDERGKKYISLAVDGATRMRRIILDLLEYSRAGRVQYKIESIDLNNLMADVVILNSRLIAEKKAQVKFEKLPTLNGSRSQLQQLFYNLIGNALKFVSPETTPEIIITCEDKISHWQFSVKDNGIGISPEFFNKLFVLFQRLHTTAEFEGTGIGLAVCKKVVERHEGDIWVESELKKGTTFFFTISKTLRQSHE